MVRSVVDAAPRGREVRARPARRRRTPFQLVAQVFGEKCAWLERDGRHLADADVQIAATAVRHHLVLVTGNVRHFGREPALEIDQVLAEAKNSGLP